MALLSFTLNGVVFSGLSSANGKYALGFTASPIESIIRYHIPGTIGSLTGDCGLIGYKIRARVRYVSTTPYTDFSGDAATMNNATASIVGPDKTYTRCRLEPDGARVVRDAIGMGRGVAGQQFLDAEFTFTSDGA